MARSSGNAPISTRSSESSRKGTIGVLALYDKQGDGEDSASLTENTVCHPNLGLDMCSRKW